MIQANELRIGNYISDIWSPNGFFKVTQLKKFSAVYGKDFTALYDNLNPIPLTEEILLKAGFEKESEDDKYGRVFLIPNTKYIIRIVNYGNPTKPDFGFSLEISDDKDWCSIKRIYFIHDLQNTIFALTGGEIKMEL